MKEPFYIGVDLGTSSCKACVVDRFGAELGVGSGTYQVHRPQEGWAEQDPEDWKRAVGSAVTGAMANSHTDPASVAAMGLTSAAHIGVLIDRSAHPLRPAILWNDQRSAQLAADLGESCGELIFNQTCNEIGPAWTLPHLLWVKQNESEVWKGLERILLSKDYIVHWLTGNFVTDAATAVSSMLFNTEAQRWSHEICSILDVPQSVLPDIGQVSSVAGHLRTEGAATTGLPEGIPVVTGTLDSACETWCAGAESSGDCVVRLGTAGGIHAVWDTKRCNRGVFNYPLVDGGRWFSQAGTNAAGTSISWIRGILGESGSMGHKDFESLAESTEPGADGLIFHPYLDGERSPYWNSNLRGNLSGLTSRHERRHIARAVIEGVCFSLKDALISLEAISGEFRRVFVVGGGVASKVWRQVLASVLGRTLVALPSASSSRGAALLAISALEPHRTVDGASRTAPEDCIVDEPDQRAVEEYHTMFGHYRSLAQRMNG